MIYLTVLPLKVNMADLHTFFLFAWWERSWYRNEKKKNDTVVSSTCFSFLAAKSNFRLGQPGTGAHHSCLGLVRSWSLKENVNWHSFRTKQMEMYKVSQELDTLCSSRFTKDMQTYVLVLTSRPDLSQIPTPQSFLSQPEVKFLLVRWLKHGEEKTTSTFVSMSLS